jgi:bacteriocin-like protein
MEQILELTEAELDEVIGGEGEPCACATTTDGDCICPPA